MLLVFMPIVLSGIAITMLAPTKYPASARLLVRPGQGHVSDPMANASVGWVTPAPKDALQVEAELARSPVIAERVIAGMGLSRLYPRLAERKLRVGETGAYQIDQEALETFAQDFEVASSSNSLILRMTYAHEDPALAAETLNRFVAAYLAFRKDVLAGEDMASLSAQRTLVEERLAAADRAMRGFEARNGLGEYSAEGAAARRHVLDASDELAKVEASLREAEARSSALTKQMASTPREIALGLETAAGQELEKLRLQREELLTRYLPDSRAVQDVERRIVQLEAVIKMSPPQGLRRVGVNPTWQALEAERALLAATLSALGARSVELGRQKREAEARIAALEALAPDYQQLKRERDALEATARTFAAREQAEAARNAPAARGADGVFVYEPARAPTKGDGAKSIVVTAAALLGLLAALGAGLMRAWSGQSFPTARAVERTLGLRVLAAARDRSP